MNADARDVRSDLAGLLPAPAERDLPGDRHRLIQEFVMTQIHPHRPPAERVPRRRPRRRLILASALTAAAAATAAVVVIGAAGPEAAAPIAGGRSAPVGTGPAGHQILLAAATTAGRTPAGSGAYWYLRTEAPDWRSESWTRRDGRTGYAAARPAARFSNWPDPYRSAWVAPRSASTNFSGYRPSRRR